jgi:hypothetical protein
MAYKGSTHYLHQVYRSGFCAGQRSEQFCPHVPGTKECDWWWAGWGEGVLER